MKKMLFSILVCLGVFVSCNKESKYPFEGYQWMSDEYEECDPADFGNSGSAMLPAGKLILDVGVTKSGKAYLLWQVKGSNAHYSGGEIVKLIESEYQFDAKNGTFAMKRFEGNVSFLAENKVKFLEGGTNVYIFERATKEVKVKSAINPLPAGPIAFTITADKDDDWAGGTIKFSANAAVQSWSCQLANEEDKSLTASLESTINADGELTVGSYYKYFAAGVSSPKNVQIKVIATSVSGETASYIVLSKGWKFEVEEVDGMPLLTYGSGDAIRFGPQDVDNEWASDFFTNTNWDWSHNCLMPYAQDGGVCADILYANQIQDASHIKDKEAPYYIKLTYGKETKTFTDLVITSK